MPSDTASTEKDLAPSFGEFKRQSALFSGVPGVNSPDMVSLSTGYWSKLGPLTLPHEIPWHVIDLMGYHPHIRLAEEIWRALLRNVELYRVEHEDPAIKAETEAWLRPILPFLLNAASLAFAYGVVPYVLDWDSADLAFTVKKDGKKPFTKTIKDHVHYTDLHELHPGNVTLRTKADRLVSMRYVDQDYQPDRAFVSVWGRTFGGWLGHGSRRVAYKPFFRGEHCELWRGRFLERNVDPPRVARAPEGTLNVDGQDVPAAEIMTDAVMGLKGGGVATIPSALLGASNEQAFGIDTMDLKAGESSSVFNQAINLCNIEMFIASLVPPTAAGIQDAAFASGRVHAELLEDLLNVASNWLAQQVSAPVEVVSRVRYGDSKKPARVRARQFPKAKAKLFLAVFEKIKDVQRTINGDGGKELIYTPADLVRDVELLEDLGVPIHSPEDVAREKPAEPPAGEPGPPKDPMSDRQERRDNAREPEGEDATGKEGEGIDGNERD